MVNRNRESKPVFLGSLGGLALMELPSKYNHIVKFMKNQSAYAIEPIFVLYRSLIGPQRRIVIFLEFWEVREKL